MANQRVIKVVGSDCLPEVEEKFNQWYNEVHIPWLLKNPRLLSVTRYCIAKAIAPPIPLDPKLVSPKAREREYSKYLAIYEFESEEALEEWERSPEHADARADTHETWKDGGFMSWSVNYKAMKSWMR